MDCTLAALIACFSWSNLYIDSGLSWQDAGIYHQYERYDSERIVSGALTETISTDQRWQSQVAANPYGRVALGYEVSFQRLAWRLEASHMSSLSTGQDRGINAVSVSARWFPFRRR